MVPKLEAAPFRKPPNKQRLPDDLENSNMILQFHHFVIEARRRMQYPLAKIFNITKVNDQASVYTFARLIHE